MPTPSSETPSCESTPRGRQRAQIILAVLLCIVVVILVKNSWLRECGSQVVGGYGHDSGQPKVQEPHFPLDAEQPVVRVERDVGAEGNDTAVDDSMTDEPGPALVFDITSAPADNQDDPFLPPGGATGFSDPVVVIQSTPTLQDNETTLAYVPDDGGGIDYGLQVVLPVVLILVFIISIFLILCLTKYGYINTKLPSLKFSRSMGKYDFTDHHRMSTFSKPEIIHTVDVAGRAKMGSQVIQIELPAAQGAWYKALYVYTAEDENQLSLAVGSYVDVVEMEDTGWWKGYIENTGGWFPASYVEKINLEDITILTRSPVRAGRSMSLPASIPSSESNASVDMSSILSSLKQQYSQTALPDMQKTYVATCIYKPGAADELEVKPGDELAHMNRDPNGWVKVKNKVNGCQGWVPMACLRLEGADEADGISRDGSSFFNESTDGSNPGSPEKSPRSFSGGSPRPHSGEVTPGGEHVHGLQYRAMYRYEVRHEGDLAFEPGDIVAVLETQDNGWCRGIRGDQEGWFPASYVQMVPQTPSSDDSGYTSPLAVVPPPPMFADIKKDLSTVFEEENDNKTVFVGHSKPSESETHAGEPSSPFEAGMDQWKPQVPKRFVRPKLVKVKKSAAKKRSSLERPRDPAPPPPSQGHRKPSSEGTDNQAFDVVADKAKHKDDKTSPLSVVVEIENPSAGLSSGDSDSLVHNEYICNGDTEEFDLDRLPDPILDFDESQGGEMSDLMSEILAEVSPISRASLSRTNSSANDQKNNPNRKSGTSSPEHEQVNEMLENLKNTPTPANRKGKGRTSTEHPLKNVDNRTPTPFAARTQQPALAVVHSSVKVKGHGTGPYEDSSPIRDLGSPVGRKDIPVATIRPMQGSSTEDLSEESAGSNSELSFINGHCKAGQSSSSNSINDQKTKTKKNKKKGKNSKDLKISIPSSPCDMPKSVSNGHVDQDPSGSRLELTVDKHGQGHITLHLGDANDFGEESTTDEVTALGTPPRAVTPPNQIFINDGTPFTHVTPLSGVLTPLTVDGEVRRSRRSRHRPRVPPPPPPPTTTPGAESDKPPPLPSSAPPPLEQISKALSPEIVPSPVAAPRRSKRASPVTPLEINTSTGSAAKELPSPTSPKPKVPPKPKLDMKRRMSEPPVRSPSDEWSPFVRPNSTSPKKEMENMKRHNAMPMRRKKIAGPPLRPPPPRPPPPSSPTSESTDTLKVTLSLSNGSLARDSLRRAAKSYQAQGEGELSFSRDSFISELGEVSSRPGWMMGMLPDGTTGCYPSHHTHEENTYEDINLDVSEV